MDIDRTNNTVTVTHGLERSWAQGDRVCFYRDSSEVACGEITNATHKTAIVDIKSFRDGVTNQTKSDGTSGAYVELVFGRLQMKKSDTPRLAVGPSERTPADESHQQILVEGLVDLRRSTQALENQTAGKEDLLTEIPHIDRDDDERRLDHGAISMLNLGMNYIFPTIQYQQSVSDGVAVGVMPMYLSTPVGNGKITGYGVFLTLTRYSIEDFHGDFISLGLGYHRLNATVGTGPEVEYNSPAALVNFGWRWMMDSGVNFGFALGIQYMLSPRPAASSLDFSGLLPSIALDCGFAF